MKGQMQTDSMKPGMKTSRIRRAQRLSLLTSIITLTALYSQQGFAWTCTPKTSSITINVGAITAPRTMPNLAPLTPVLIHGSGGYNCHNPDSGLYAGIKAYGTFTNLIIHSNKVFTTNLSGVGFVIGSYTDWIGGSTGSVGGSTGGPDWLFRLGVVADNTVPLWSWVIDARIQLYKIGNLDSGTLSSKVGALIVGNRPAPPITWGTEVPIYINGTVNLITCSLNSTSINVPLGDVDASKFTGIATTVGDQTFNLGLSCEKDAKINVSLTGSQNADTADTSVLALTNAGQSGTASGVGVQLLYDATPLKINNKILLKTSGGGQETLPFSARYYQTQTAIGGGLANSSATLNITYQ